MSSSMSLSQTSSSSSTEEDETEQGVLDDIVGIDDYHSDPKKSENPETTTTSSSSPPPTEQISMRTRQRKRGSFVVATKPLTSNKTKKRTDASQRRGLFQKRLYTYPTAASSAASSRSSLRQSMLMSTAEAALQPKTEVEKAVLKDCIQNHFLLACNNACQDSDFRDPTTTTGEHEFSSHLMVGALISRFEKVSLRKNEILFEEGTSADYLYVLYRGEVMLRSRNDPEPLEEKENEKDYYDDYEDDDDDEDGGSKYQIFGELELMTNSSVYRGTAKALSDSCVLFRLGAADFQSYFLPQHHPEPEELEEEEDRLLELLRKALPSELSSVFFQNDGDDNDEDYQHNIKLWKRLLSERKVRNFRKGDVLIHKTKPIRSLVIIEEGLVRATNNTAGGRSYEDLWIGPGKARNSFGWQSVLKLEPTTSNHQESKEPASSDNGNKTADDKSAITKGTRKMTGTIRAETDGRAIVISKKSFEKVFSHLCYNHEQGEKVHHHDGRSLLMDVADLRMRRWKRTQLQQIMVFKDSALDSTQINGLLDLMHSCEYGAEEPIFKSGQRVDAAMYFVREGSVRLELNRGRDKQLIERGGYFGEKNMLLDQNKSDSEKEYKKRSVMSAISVSNGTKVDILYLEECRKVVNTTTLGLGMNSSVNSIDSSVQWADLRRHKLIGTGSFGQVWLTSTEKSAAVDDTINNEEKSNGAPQRRLFALKVQGKYSVFRSGNADRLIAERNVMSSLNSPFIMRLFNAFQDEYRLYMVTSLLPGGELEAALPKKGFSEATARFYAAGILEGLTYMHRKHILHRDVKPENVLLDAKGYPVLIDLGFAKYVPEKTYTMCGSPLFMAPETILYNGQTKGVDHWSWAVLVYRLVTAKYAFYQKGMDEIALYKRICKGTFEVTGAMSVEFRMLMIAMLYPDPTQRLGSRANGWRDIFDSPWFAVSSFSSSDLPKLRKQTLPAPWIPPKANQSSSDPGGSFVHQSSDTVDDLFDNDVCGKIADNQQHIFSSFGSQVTSPMNDPLAV